MSGRRKAAEAPAESLEQELGVLTVERERLAREHLFREVAVENVETMHAQARRQLDAIFPPMSFVDSPQARLLSNPGLASLFVVASDWWRQEQLERIAGDPRPGHAAQWSVLTRAESAARVVEIDARLQVLDRELQIAAAEQQAADALARAEALKRGERAATLEPVPAAVPAAAGAVVADDEDDEGHKGPA